MPTYCCQQRVTPAPPRHFHTKAGVSTSAGIAKPAAGLNNLTLGELV